MKKKWERLFKGEDVKTGKNCGDLFPLGSSTSKLKLEVIRVQINDK